MRIANLQKKEYCFSWLGKEDAFNQANSPTDKYLMPQQNKSLNWNNTENIYIEGDNTDALKLLKKDFEGKIRAIYIDPPYNTKKDFIYKDKYKKSEWCSMIYKSLLIGKELLSEDGIIFISIDDNEVHNMKNICDEVFGSENFVTQFIYEKTQHFGRQKLNAYSNAEYVLCYAKCLIARKTKELLVEKICTEFEDAPLYNASNNLTILNFPPEAVSFKIKDGIYTKTDSKDYELLNPVEIKNGLNKNNFSIRFKSRWSQKKVLEEIKKGTGFLIKTKSFAIRAVYGKNKISKIAPKQIIFTNKKNVYCTYNRFDRAVTTSETGKKDFESIMNEYTFSYPKPVSLISYLLSLIYDYKKNKFADDFYVLDFFSGSATTAQAVLELNLSDNGNRKFIMVQKPESYEFSNNKQFETICDIGEERIRRFINNSKDSNFGFKVYKVV